MIVSEFDILRAAHLHPERHGDQAVARARQMVRTLKESADTDGADIWLRIIVAIETMRRGVSGPRSAPEVAGTASASSNNGPTTSWS